MRGCHYWSEHEEVEAGGEDQRLYREARRRAHRRLEFLQHLSVFAPVIVLILAIDILAGNDWFIQWVAGIWGGILLIHFLHAFLLDDLLGARAERSLTERELRQLEERARRQG